MNTTFYFETFNNSVVDVTEPCIAGLSSTFLIVILFLIFSYIIIMYFFIATIRSVELKNFDSYRETIITLLFHYSTLCLCLCGVLIYYLVFL